MPRVPTYQQSEGSVAPNQAQLRAPDITNGLGEIANGAARLGASMQDFAQVRDQITAMSEETQARAQALQDSQAVSKVLADYSTQQGQSAIDGQKAALDQIAAIKQAGVKAMSTPRMGRFYQQHSDEMFAGATQQAYGHAIQQTHVAYGNQLKAETDAALDGASGLYAQPDKFGAALASVGEKARAEAVFAGMGNEASAEYVKGKTGEAVIGGIRTALANEHVDLAQAISNAFGGDKLTFAQRNQVAEMMAAPLLKRQDTANAHAAMGGSTTASTQDENGQWVVPKIAGPVPGTGAPMPSNAGSGYSMPVSGARVTSTFGEERSGGEVHHGVDLAVPLNTPIKSAAAGTVIKVGRDDRAGNFVMVRHPDGFVSSYAHMGNVAVKDGDPVNANTVIGTVGLTGHTTGAHVHFRMRDPEGRDVDPMRVLGGKPGTVAAVTSPGGIPQYDEQTVIRNIKAMGLTPEREAGAIAVARQEMGQARTMQEQSYADAKDQVQAWVSNFALKHGNKYPPPEAIPSSLINAMKPADAAVFKLQIAKGREADAKGDAADAQAHNYADMMVMRYTHPDQFMATNSASLVGRLSPGQWDAFRVEQARMKAEAAQVKPWDSYKGSASALETFIRLHADPSASSMFSPKWARSNPGEAAQQRASMLESIRLQAEGDAPKRGGRAPSDQEWQAYARTAAGTVTTTGTWGSHQVHGYELKIGQIPDVTQQQIRDAFKRANGYDASDADVVNAYWANMSAARHLRP